jgi:hypothetical protein
MQLDRRVIAAAGGRVVMAAVGCAVWKAHEAGALLNGIVSINDRIEATQVDTVRRRR